MQTDYKHRPHDRHQTTPTRALKVLEEEYQAHVVHVDDKHQRTAERIAICGEQKFQRDREALESENTAILAELRLTTYPVVDPIRFADLFEDDEDDDSFIIANAERDEDFLAMLESGFHIGELTLLD